MDVRDCPGETFEGTEHGALLEASPLLEVEGEAGGSDEELELWARKSVKGY